MMRSITVKLTLAFLVIGLAGAVMVSLLFGAHLRNAFDRFVVVREEQFLVENLVQFYQTQGSWEGLPDTFSQAQEIFPQPFGNPRHQAPARIPFSLIGVNHIIVYSTLPERVGIMVPADEMEKPIALTLNNETIGWVIIEPINKGWVPNSPELVFWGNINRAAILSGLLAVGLAVLLGGIFAYTTTRSLRELTVATGEIARGSLGGQVPVRTKDEVGKLASSFNKMSIDLARATEARKHMTADIAHELRSPLSVITGYAEALHDGKIKGTDEVYSILHQETKHLSRLVEDLRVLSLADAGELPLNLTVINPRMLLERAYKRHSLNAEQKNIKMRIEVEDNLPNIQLDPDRMASVFDNLVSNSFRYTSPGGEVVLSAKAAHNTIQFLVKDNGSGIATEDIAHIFDRFYKGDKSRQESGASGLGLAITKSIVEAQKGSIAVESTEGNGTSFTVSFPIPNSVI